MQVMTSIPLELLSPLSDYLIRFIERETPQNGYKYTSPSRLFTESSSAMAKGVETQKGGEKQSVEKKRKMVERNTFSAETNVRSKKGVLDGIDGTVKEPTETNTSYRTIAENKETASSKLFDVSKENHNGSVKREMAGDVDRRMWDLTRHKDPKTNDDASGDSRKLGIHKGGKAPDLVRKEISATKVKSGHKLEPDSSSRKQKSDHIEQEPQSSSKFKEHKSSKRNGQAEKKKVAAVKQKNDGRKTEDTYKDFFGDMEDSEEEEEEEQKCSVDVTEKGLPALEDMPEKSSFTRTDSQNVGPGPVLSKPGSDPSLPKANPVIIQDNWVACDKCGKWRLLPYGVLPEDLPKKWMCTMLNWL